MLAEPLVARLWTRMTEIYNHRWTSANGEDPRGSAGQTWAKGLAGLTPQQIGRGLEAAIARGDGWPPNLPEFRGLCLGIPDFAEVNRELLCVESAKRTPFARLVWTCIDGYAHRHAPARDAERMRREAYDLACDHVMRGGELPAEPVAVIEQQAAPRPHGIPTTPEARRERLQQILAKVDPNHELRSLHHEPEPADVEKSLREHYAHVQPTPTDPTGEVEADERSNRD